MAPPATDLHIFGVRHHGPGSARSLVRALESLEPDAVLVEGPPDADALLPLVLEKGMKPPVALLVYRPDDPDRAAFYPFARFSPEWQAISYALSRGVAVRFADLPCAVRFAEPPREARCAAEGGDAPPREDPLDWLARAAGYGDGERWWEQMVEQRLDGADLFEAIAESMKALRDASPEDDQREARREAAMRESIRAARREGFGRIAVVCGAWHVPALGDGPGAEADAALLAGLGRVKVEATWVPWTYGRLALESGYGAGVASPGWYHHLWSAPDRVAVRWMARVARLLRGEELDASPGHVVEAVRLAEALAALRGRPLPGLDELDEAARAVFCLGADAPMRLIRDRLVVGDRLGRVPDAAPSVPLERDLQRELRRLRLKREAGERTLDLDLRKAGDLERSHLLHRLLLCGIAWGSVAEAKRARGTFHEIWRLRWAPELAVRVVEASAWGATVGEAAAARARSAARDAAALETLTELLDRVLLADLPDAARAVMERVESEAAVASDVARLMAALPPLASILRYGNVRRTDAEMVRHVVDGLVARISVGLAAACASLDDAAAAEMSERVDGVDAAVATLGVDEHRRAWHAALDAVAGLAGGHGLVAGRATRLLLDAGAIDRAEAARRMGLALSSAEEPSRAGAWVEGMLRGSGAVLLHDASLFGLLDAWLCGLGAGAFTETLPLLRRTVSTFAAAERRRIGERVRHGAGRAGEGGGDSGFDAARADAVLPLVATLLGLEGGARALADAEEATTERVGDTETQRHGERAAPGARVGDDER